MYLDRQLWPLTAGVQTRILATVVLGLLAVSAGIARLALLGWLLGRVLAGVPLAALIGPVSAVALAIGLRGGLDYARTMVAHGTAARVQALSWSETHLARVGRIARRPNDRDGRLSAALTSPVGERA
jgi:ATP-binding cassette subfamily C protein CydCD